MSAVELMVDCRNRHGEGVFWSEQHQLLYWTDIQGCSVWTLSPESGRARSFSAPGRVCCLADRHGCSWNKVVAGFDDGFALLDLETGERRTLTAFEPDLPSTRLNDGRTDRQGRFVAGGMDEHALAPISSVWRLDPDLTATKLFGDVGCANGTCFSPPMATLCGSPTARPEQSKPLTTTRIREHPATVGRSLARRRPASRMDPAWTARASSGTLYGKATGSSAMRPMEDWTGSSRSPSRSRRAVPSAAAICPHCSSRARISANHRKHWNGSRRRVRCLR